VRLHEEILIPVILKVKAINAGMAIYILFLTWLPWKHESMKNISTSVSFLALSEPRS
jgi:hypothetical protein